MATNATWTVVFEDKMIIKQSGDGAGSYNITGEDSFWSDSKWSNIWAIQYVADNEGHNDTVEYRDTTPHASWTDADLGSFQSQFIDKWDAAHLARLQADWDADVIITYNEDGSVDTTESESDQIARKGPRPTSYSS
tara:strand:+ start:1258 stop:1665 length:408 start_codon:yes stop_codon:yes gene_type:complete